MNPNRILVLKPCCLGDVLMATPLLRAVAEAWPAATIDWAVDRHSQAVLAGNPHLADLVDATGVIRGQMNLRSILGLWRRMRRGRYDVVFVPDRAPLLALLAWLAGIPERVGLDSGGRGWSYTVKVPGSLDIIKSEADLYLDLARAVGIAVGSLRPEFVPSAADVQAADRVLEELGWQPANPHRLMALHPAGGVNPGMTLLSKRWPAERFAELAARLLGEGLADGVLVLGGQDDVELAATVCELAVSRILTHRRPNAAESSTQLGSHYSALPTTDGIHSVAGRLSLGATGALLARCRLFVGNDTGVAHLAMAVGTPAVVIFGPSDPRRYGPPPGLGVAVSADRSPGGEGAEHAYAGTAQDLRSTVGSNAILDVTVRQVIAAIRELARFRGDVSRADM